MRSHRPLNALLLVAAIVVVILFCLGTNWIDAGNIQAGVVIISIAIPIVPLALLCVILATTKENGSS